MNKILLVYIIMEEAKKQAKKRNIDLKKVPLKDIKKGLEIEKEHNKITKNKPDKRMQIVIDHLIEYPDYYKRLDKMEKQAEKEWKDKDKEIFKGKGQPCSTCAKKKLTKEQIARIQSLTNEKNILSREIADSRREIHRLNASLQDALDQGGDVLTHNGPTIQGNLSNLRRIIPIKIKKVESINRKIEKIKNDSETDTDTDSDDEATAAPARPRRNNYMDQNEQYLEGTGKDPRGSLTYALKYYRPDGTDSGLKGEGITDIITDPIGTMKKAFSDIDDYNNISRETLEKYGNIPTTIITIARTPLQPMLETAINAISLNQFKQLKQKYGYDKLYHLTLIVGLRGGQKIVIEKNETVTIEPLNFSKSIKNITEFQKIPIIKPLTINIMLDKAKQKMGSYNFFHYDAFQNNCQDFLRNILEANGLLTPAGRKFLYQEDVKNIGKDLEKSKFSYVPKVMKKITNMASIVSRLSGKGKEEKEEIRKEFIKYLKKKNIDTHELNYINEKFIDFINTEGLKFL